VYIGFTNQAIAMPLSELKGWLLDWIGKASSDDISWLFSMLYNLWHAHNDARETKRMEDPWTTAQKTIVVV
jgi:hypothetical protein